MNLHVVSCNHQSSGLAIRERLAFSSAEDIQRAYQEFHERFPTSEVVFLSTCNRVEVYAANTEEDPAVVRQNLASFLSEFHHVPLEEFSEELTEHTGPEAVQHLFQVVSSLDSMVLGEPQIVAQVKDAYRKADENGSCGALTHALFQGAIRTSNRVRTETRLSNGRVSIASVAVGEFGKSIFDTFADKLVVVIGAGEMAEETLRYLADEGVQQVIVVNRSRDRAERLAEKYRGQVADWQQLDEWLGKADVIVSTTGADEPVVTMARFELARSKQNRYKPVFIIDLGAPRDFDAKIASLDDVYLYDIDSLQKTCDRNRKLRQAEVEKANRIIEEETQRFMSEFYSRAGGAIVKRLRDDWHSISQQELQKLFSKLSHLPAEDRDAIERTVARIVNKLLHPPLEALRDESKGGSPNGLLDALSRLFRLR
ncbi:Glutamyl-tRNA reductase [Planctopirus ephydatiae]|uniref:Glutamyl-tRNA reductase n=1 Tax=Planctopirus ephydatiae TaxID=2528019 RepID=A0A518GN82_9PLAN|nr:glutamyl-tRNA reductase [Planctopirus ephydatiae]QDV30026.1 Glutamyl-tRNA reductase [Planctopirus ephydatiae]